MNAKLDNVDFTLRIDSAGCAIDVRVNDCPVQQDRMGYPGVGELPVNHWLRSGGNELSFRLSPIPGTDGFDDDTECTVTLVSVDPAVAARSELGSLRFCWPEENSEPSARLDPLEPIVRTIEVSVATTFPQWSWERGEGLNASATAPHLVDVYRRFHRALAAESIDDVSSMLMVRIQEMAAAQYIEVHQQIESTRAEFLRLFGDPKWSLAELDSDSAHPVLYAGARLIRLEDEFGKSPLYFEQGELAYYLSAFCSRSTSSDLVICR